MQEFDTRAETEMSRASSATAEAAVGTWEAGPARLPCLFFLPSLAETETYTRPVHRNLHPAAVRCDMVLHQAFRARLVRKIGIDGEVRHGVQSGVSCETSKA